MIEFTTAKGSKVTIELDGTELRATVRGECLYGPSISTHPVHGLSIITTDRIVPVVAEAREAVLALAAEQSAAFAAREAKVAALEAAVAAPWARTSRRGEVSL